MEIIIKKKSGQYRITRDPHCFVLEKLKRDGSWESAGYFSQIHAAVHKLVTLGIMEKTDHTNIVEIVRETCDKLGKAIEKAIGGLNANRPEYD